MRRLILIFFVFLVLGTGLTLVFRDGSGYVLVSFAGWQLETSLLFKDNWATRTLLIVCNIHGSQMKS